MRSEHDHWGEMRAIAKKLKRERRTRAPGDMERSKALWTRYRELTISLDAMITRLYGDRP